MEHRGSAKVGRDRWCLPPYRFKCYVVGLRTRMLLLMSLLGPNSVLVMLPLAGSRHGPRDEVVQDMTSFQLVVLSSLISRALARSEDGICDWRPKERCFESRDYRTQSLHAKQSFQSNKTLRKPGGVLTTYQGLCFRKTSKRESNSPESPQIT